ncbi:MAG: TRAP transporter small permease [Alphaproteobacteria bacterium]|nr:TRAP transporter small permease [Alphaproteobacteria bacterium]
MSKFYRGWVFFMENVVSYIAALLMLGATALAIIEIFRRYLLGTTYHWGQDAVTYFMVSAVFMFFVVTQVKRSHLAVTALAEWMTGKGYKAPLQLMRVINTSLSLGFCGALSWFGFPSVMRNLELGRLTQSMILPYWPFQAVLLLSFMLMVITLLFQLYQDIQMLRGKDVFPWADVDEGIEV